MRISKIRIKNYRSIKDSGDIELTDNLFVLAGQNESGKSSYLEALDAFESGVSDKETLNFELENNGDLIQEISCTYVGMNEDFYESLEDSLYDLIATEIPKIAELTIKDIINTSNLRLIKRVTISRIFDFTQEKLTVYDKLDSTALGILKSSILDYTDESVELEKQKKTYLDVDLYSPDIADKIWAISPKIILFNDFTALLPDKILLSELKSKDAQGVKAVNNLGGLLKNNFEKISQKNTPQKNSTTEAESEILSADFQKDWKQKIYGNNKVNIKFFIENNDKGSKEISFFVETKDNEFLAPRKRSKGMIWFLSLWLELKAQENGDPLILLFDEPGLHLHIKANKDMLSVFHKLIEKGHQIIYSTHSPSLIETDKLHNIGLVINHEKHGSLIEGLTTSKLNSENKRDALQPIAEAMGMEPLKDFSILRQKNVLVEGLSDFWIFKGMNKLINPNSDYEFIPGVGVKGSKIYPLISFCIGYGLDWLLVMDNGEYPNRTRNDLKNNIFSGNDEETDKKIKILPVENIENTFDLKDLALVDPNLKIDTSKKPVDVIGNRRKILFAKMFYSKVENGEVKKTHLQIETQNKFDEIFSWIEKQFSIK